MQITNVGQPKTELRKVWMEVLDKLWRVCIWICFLFFSI